MSTTAARRTTARGISALIGAGLATTSTLAVVTSAGADVRPRVLTACATTDGVGLTLTRSNVDYYLTGACKQLTITGSNTTVDLYTASTVIVQGNGNRVDASTIGHAIVTGDDHALQAVTLKLVKVKGNRASVSASAQIEKARLVGNRNQVSTANARVVRVKGNRNRVLARASTETRLRGNRNVVRLETLDALRVKGNRNTVSVQAGRTDVRVQGRKNTTP